MTAMMFGTKRLAEHIQILIKDFQHLIKKSPQLHIYHSGCSK